MTFGCCLSLQDAYARLRETAVEFGEQRIYASHSSIMFSRMACHFFVRPKRKHLELISDSDKEKAGRTMNAMLKMKKIDIAELKHAANDGVSSMA